MANIMRLGGGGGGAKIGVTLNEDGTQNLLISDNGTVFDLASLTADADASVEDVTAGKVFYAKGYRYVGTADNAPVLLWTNASPTSGFSGNISCEKYDGYLFECRYSDTSEGTKRPVYISASDLATDQYIFVGSSWLTSPTARTVRYADGNLVFGIGRVNSATSNNYCIPLRIWGVKFTL